jgi:hypothetical protein
MIVTIPPATGLNNQARVRPAAVTTMMTALRRHRVWSRESSMVIGRGCGVVVTPSILDLFGGGYIARLPDL